MTKNLVTTINCITLVTALRGSETTLRPSQVVPTAPGLCPGATGARGENRRVISGAAQSRDENEETDRADEVYRHGERVPSDETVRHDEATMIETPTKKDGEEIDLKLADLAL